MLYTSGALLQTCYQAPCTTLSGPPLSSTVKGTSGVALPLAGSFLAPLPSKSTVVATHYAAPAGLH